MARLEMESRVDDHNSGTPNSCRMEVLRQDGWSNGSIIQPCHRHRNIATQTSTVSAPLPHIPTQDAFSSDSVQQQDNLLRDNTGTEQEVSSLRERPPLPLPDLLAETLSSSEDSTSSSSSIAEDDPTLEEQAVERVANQLRTIGDEMNTVFLQRNVVPHWQNWRGLYRGLVAFVSDTINALYQHGLR